MSVSASKYISFERDKNTIICGPTASGKTSLLIDILTIGVFTPSHPSQVFIVSPEETTQAWTEDVRDRLEKVYGSDKCHFLFGEQALDNLISNSDHIPQNSIVVFDDFMGYLSNKDRKTKLDHWSYVVTHHRHIWTFFVTHNLFVSGILTIRRNTNNFILFNVLQSDKAAATSFIQRVVGLEFSEVCVNVLQTIVDGNPHGWLRLDNRLFGKDLKGVTILSTTSPSLSEAEIFVKSTGEDAPLDIGVLRSSVFARLPALTVPEGVERIEEENGNPSTGDASEHGAADMLVDDEHQLVS